MLHLLDEAISGVGVGGAVQRQLLNLLLQGIEVGVHELCLVDGDHEQVHGDLLRGRGGLHRGQRRLGRSKILP